jgi:hypothetical protein
VDKPMGEINFDICWRLRESEFVIVFAEKKDREEIQTEKKDTKSKLKKKIEIKISTLV